MTLTSCELGIRNFIVGVTVRIASEEINLRRERAYLNKLNLALVQVRACGFNPPATQFRLNADSSDPQTRMAPQLAKFRP